MPLAGTENAITIDANVFTYIVSYIVGESLPRGLIIEKMSEFIAVTFQLDIYKIVLNDFIRAELANCISSKTSQRLETLLATRGKTIDVDPIDIPITIRNSIRDQYGFQINSRDMTYVKTCYNTIMKLLITNNTKDFMRPHVSGRKKRGTMDMYIHDSMNITIQCVDESCEILFSGAVETFKTFLFPGQTLST